MPNGTDINPKTGKRYNYVDTDKIRQSVTAARTIKASLEARDSLMAFTRFTMPDPAAPSDVSRTLYDSTKFHVEVAKALEAVERGDLRQLIFCMPPRHGKSELATRRMASWYAGRHPDHDVIVASASDTLASDFGGDVRAIMQSPRFKLAFPKFRLRRGGTAKDNIQTAEGGRLVFAGRGGQINGRGAHLLLIDDLMRDFEDARSKAMRDLVWNWLMKVAFYRRMGKKLTIITMTRWHSDDVIGRLTYPENPYYNAEEAAKWKIIRLPALAEHDDPLGRELGAALWPARFDEEYLGGLRRQDPLGFAALQQQSPTVADGVLFKREHVRYYDDAELPDDLRFYAASDHAVGMGQRNDPSCFLKIGVDRGGNIYLLDVVWQKIPTDRAVEAMLVMGAEGNARPLVWWAEKGHISKSIGPFLYKRMQETNRFLNMREVTPIGDKEQRAQSIAARFASGKVLFPRNRWWTEPAINEMMAFPNGLHDDFVDALAYIGLGLQSVHSASMPATKNLPPKYGSLNWVKQQDRWQRDEANRKSAGGF